MGKISSSIKLFNKEELKLIHNASIDILAEPGMKFVEREFLEALEKKGCKIDYKHMTARFPSSLIEETIRLMKEDLNKRPPMTSGDELEYRYTIPGLPAVKIYDYERGEIREGTERDALQIIRLADALKDIKKISSVLFYSVDLSGKSFHKELWSVKIAALLAKNTPKISVFELTHHSQIDYLLEIECILKGTKEPSKDKPMLQTVCYLMSPLMLGNPAAKILLKNTKRGFPIFMGNMPITGISSPVRCASNIALGNAEILGAVTACKAINPNAPYKGEAIVSCTLDMKTGSISLASPEVAMQDMGLRELYTDLYGLSERHMASFETDGNMPGGQACFERGMLNFRNLISGLPNYMGGGYLCQGQIYSMEQLIVDIEIAKWMERFSRGIEINEETLGVKQIREAGIGGNFLESDYTLNCFKDELWQHELFVRGGSSAMKLPSGDELYARASEKVKKIMDGYKPFVLEEGKARKIDEVVRRVEEEIPRILAEEGNG